MDKVFQRVSLYLKFHCIIMVYKENFVRKVRRIDKNLRTMLSQKPTFSLHLLPLWSRFYWVKTVHCQFFFPYSAQIQLIKIMKTVEQVLNNGFPHLRENWFSKNITRKYRSFTTAVKKIHTNLYNLAAFENKRGRHFGSSVPQRHFLKQEIG